MSNFYENEHDSLPLRENESPVCLCRNGYVSLLQRVQAFVSLPVLWNEYDSENEIQPASMW